MHKMQLIIIKNQTRRESKKDIKTSSKNYDFYHNIRQV